MSAILLRKRVVLDFEGVNSYEEIHTAYFGTPVVDDDEVPEMSLFISEDDWREMGKPEQLTVTVEPGDKLDG